MATRPPSYRRRVFAGLCLGLIVVGTAAGMWRASQRTETVSSVVRGITEIIRAEPDGGAVGPWWIHAGQYDSVTGEFGQVSVRTGELQLGARRARLRVDPLQDTFSLELENVVFTKVPRRPDTGTTFGLQEFERYTLGPAPYNRDIIPD